MKRILFILTVVLLQSSTSYGQQPINRVEPPNWWIGMQYNEVELMVYGQDIASYSVSLDDYEGVTLKQIKQVPNRNYLFLDLKIDGNARPGNLTLRFTKNEAEPVIHSYPLLKRDPESKNVAGFNSSDAIYLITPDRFVNGDTGNDTVDGLKEKADRTFKGGRHGGDVQGIVNSLDYIKDLGFTAIWINPILENDMQTYSYHGYSTTDFYKVDPRYGSNESFKSLCKEARDKGMKVIMDMIANHCGLDHWWMQDLPSEDWINQWPEYTETNHKKTVILDPYASKIDYKQFFDGWFVPSMPDLNQRNESMAKYLIQNTLWWIEYSGISGIRMDTYPYPDMYFMSDWTKAVMDEYPNFNIVGEEWVTRPTIVSYWQKGKKNQNGYTSYLKSLMDFPLQNALVTSLNKEKTWASSWTDLYETLGQDYLYPDPNNLVVFPDNHDMGRIYTQLNEDFDKYKLALTYIATVRGIPQIYYGTEILMKNPGTDDHGIIRSDFPGGWKNDKVNAFTGKGLSAKEKEAQGFVKKLMNWRKNSTLVHSGKLMHFAPKNQDETYVMFRYDDKEKIMVVLNKNTKDMELDLKPYKEILGDQLTGKDVLSGTEFTKAKKISVKAMGAMIIEVE
ncbi:glycoside hydrolase family 13 protein [Maribacter polysiphoniae]|uniref:Glycosidase n=1 Tax=Maribacter polysiphoniae TaxID=429344 RepID=A0A316E979_9FLAO|nr:glycoside hydrolase family 13 protein [Maribacter polysiphoniae]MBD1260464.1 glycoside hydrolase family 13 protein [Maribacter polysiphoniae]PWK25929.1 glycosidase [Maribacter polysiphoniae]